MVALCTGIYAACGSSGPHTAADLTNPALSPAYSQWLVGPISALATPQEIRAYLACVDDAAAESFIATFWKQRDPDPNKPGNPVYELYRSRAEEADRRFSEAGYLGRRTARGTLFVLYGEPEEDTFETGHRTDEPPVEVWKYPPNAARGLDGRAPQHLYRFVKQGDLTVLYRAEALPFSPARPPF